MKSSALESITTNKASGGDGIPVELSQIMKDDAVKVLHSICQQIWKTQQWPQDWKRSVFIPVPKKGSNYRTIALISHASKVMLKILQARLQQYVNCELPDVKLVLETAEEPEIKLPASAGSLITPESFRKTSALLTVPKTLTVWINKDFDCVDQNKLWKILKEMVIPDHLTYLLRNLYEGQEVTVEPDMEQQTGPKLGKKYVKAYLSCMQSTS